MLKLLSCTLTFPRSLLGLSSIVQLFWYVEMLVHCWVYCNHWWSCLLMAVVNKMMFDFLQPSSLAWQSISDFRTKAMLAMPCIEHIVWQSTGTCWTGTEQDIHNIMECQVLSAHATTRMRARECHSNHEVGSHESAVCYVHHYWNIEGQWWHIHLSLIHHHLVQHLSFPPSKLFTGSLQWHKYWSSIHILFWLQITIDATHHTHGQRLLHACHL